MATKWNAVPSSPRMFVICLAFFSSLCYAQTDVTLDSKYYLSAGELNTLLNKIENAPKTNRSCDSLDCTKINIYYNSLLTLREDILKYEGALAESHAVSKRQWFQYLDDTYKNETLKWGLITNLRFRDAWTNFSSSVLDLSSLWSGYKTGAGINPGTKSLSRLDAGLAAVDGSLSAANIIMKALTKDGSKSIIGSLSSDDWNNIYSGLRSAYTLITEATDAYKKIDKTVGLSPNDVSKFKRLQRANIAAAIVQFVNIYVSYQNNQMREHIKELDKVLGPNQQQQSFHYQKYILKQKLLDSIEAIKREIDIRYDDIFDINLDCKGATLRPERPQIPIDDKNYGTALEYYKQILIGTTQTIETKWIGIKDCLTKVQKFKLAISDGVGKKRTAFIEVIRNRDDKQMFRGSTNSKYFWLELPPDEYRLFLYEGQIDNSITALRTEIDPWMITRDDVSPIPIDVYGRVDIRVFDENKNALVFRYKLRNSKGDVVSSSFTASDKPQIFDVPVGTYTLELAYQSKPTNIEKESIVIQAKKQLDLHFIYKEDKTFESIEVTENPNTNTSEVVTTANWPKDTKWIYGTLFNSLNGTCNEKNKYLYIINQGAHFINVKTGEISRGVLLAPGESIQVGIPSDDAPFIRAFVANSLTDMTDLGARISYWAPKSIINGWWFSSGCDDGTQPSTRCDNGKGELGTYLGCVNIGQ